MPASEQRHRSKNPPNQRLNTSRKRKKGTDSRGNHAPHVRGLGYAARPQPILQLLIQFARYKTTTKTPKKKLQTSTPSDAPQKEKKDHKRLQWSEYQEPAWQALRMTSSIGDDGKEEEGKKTEYKTLTKGGRDGMEGVQIDQTKFWIRWLVGVMRIHSFIFLFSFVIQMSQKKKK